MRAILAASLALSGCVYAETHRPDGTVERQIGPGVVVLPPLTEGRRKVQALGVAYTGRAAVAGWASVDTAILSECGLVIVTDRPDLIPPDLRAPC